MSVTAPRRAPAERALIDYMRTDAWRFDDPESREGLLARLIPTGEHAFNPYELNVLYEFVALSQTVEVLFGYLHANEGVAKGGVPSWMGELDYSTDTYAAKPDVASMPLQMLLAVAVMLRSEGDPDPETHDPLVAWGTVRAWRQMTKHLRTVYRPWCTPEALPILAGMATQRIRERDYAPGRAGQLRPVITLATESILRIAWLFECEAMDSLSFGPVSDRRLPTDPAKAVVVLRRFAEQQPELRKVPAFVHVAPREPSTWMRPRDYARMAYPPVDPAQTRAIIADVLANRRYMHDHLAVIEVDRKPIKRLVLAPELHDKRYGVTYLNCLVEHEKGTFAAEVMIGEDPAGQPVFALALPFGSHAWRSLADQERARRAGGDLVELPPDRAIIGIVVAAWRDLVVANVREQQYESVVERDDSGGKKGKRAERKAKRGHVKIVRYLPRTVVIRRAIEQERIANPDGPKGVLRRAYRVGAFAKMLREGTHRSAEAAEFAEEIGMPLRDDQTIVRPHIRGGTEAEREALLAQDDVRLWRSWAAVDLLFATRTRGAVE